MLYSTFNSTRKAEEEMEVLACQFFLIVGMLIQGREYNFIFAKRLFLRSKVFEYMGKIRQGEGGNETIMIENILHVQSPTQRKKISNSSFRWSLSNSPLQENKRTREYSACEQLEIKIIYMYYKLITIIYIIVYTTIIYYNFI